ncbi:MAG: bifunctional hydroxymethylpyrimidine kinase/phosphomethylpyrimidine kinase [Ottowia sp.]
MSDARAAARRPVVWSIAGTDSGGGAGLAADQRAAQALGVHLCPVVAAVTAQNSQAVRQVFTLPAGQLEAQLAALDDDMLPAVIKTGLLGSAENVRLLARWVDALRQRAGVRPVALVIDPVLGASTGAAFADDETLTAYRQWLLPRASLITPNAREAARLCGETRPDPVRHAQDLIGMGAQAVCITGGDPFPAPQPAAEAAQDWAADWLHTPHASGWLALPRQRPAPHTHGTGCTFATAAASALALGFVAADALVLAKMATAHAIASGYPAGQGAGPVCAASGFAASARHMPVLTWDDEPLPAIDYSLFASAPARLPDAGGDIGLYAIADHVDLLQSCLAAGVPTVQLRVKAPPAPDDAWRAALRPTLLRAMSASARAGARLFINDHWALALELCRERPDLAGRTGLHLGQEDLAALTSARRRELAASGLPLGISSHTLWELARARSLSPAYIACGPIWPTTTKHMPWQPQGLDNLAWWAAVAGRPVTAIGGILTPAQVADVAQARASGVCLVRGLGAQPAQAARACLAALQEGRQRPPRPAPALPHPAIGPC